MTEAEIAELMWWALAGSKSDRFDAFQQVLASKDPPALIAHVCQQGLEAESELDRTAAVKAVLLLIGEEPA